jgi:cell division septum initiation protein DivIVA
MTLNELPIGVWLFLGACVWAVAWTVVQSLAGRVVKNEDEAKKAAQDRAEKLATDLRVLESLIAGLKDYMRDRFDELNEKRESSSRELTERLHSLEKDLPARFSQTRHDVINQLSPRIAKGEDRMSELENRVSILEGKVA